MDKKKLARLEMLKRLSKEHDEPSIGEALKKKKLSKVEVIADSKKDLVKGLSKAQEILKAKLGEKYLEEGDEDEHEELEEECDLCEGHGCEHCEEEIEEED